jgi:hypothetical protein
MREAFASSKRSACTLVSKHKAYLYAEWAHVRCGVRARLDQMLMSMEYHLRHDYSISTVSLYSSPSLLASGVSLLARASMSKSSPYHLLLQERSSPFLVIKAEDCWVDVGDVGRPGKGRMSELNALASNLFPKQLQVTAVYNTATYAH